MTLGNASNTPANPDLTGDHQLAHEDGCDPIGIGLAREPGHREDAASPRNTDRAQNPTLIGFARVVQITRAYFELALDDVMASVLPGRNGSIDLRRTVPIRQWERPRGRGRLRGDPPT